MALCTAGNARGLDSCALSAVSLSPHRRCTASLGVATRRRSRLRVCLGRDTGRPFQCSLDDETGSPRKRSTAVQSSLVSNAPGPSGDGDSRPPPLPPPSGDQLAFARRRMQQFLADVDNAGFWSVGSGLVALSTFLLETINEERFGGWDILYRDDLNVFYYGLSTTSIGYLENVTTFLFFTEFIMRAWCADDMKKFWTSPFTWIDGVSALPALLAVAGVDYKIQRICRLLRVLRLLRLLEREPDSVLFGVMQSDNMSVQLIGVAAEFVCIFCVSAGVIFDLEYGVNENVHTLADTLYWAFLTLTGIGQPFEIQTPAGKVATVLSVLVALIVVPGQLAKLAAASSGRMMMEAMKEEEDAIANDFQIGAGVRVSQTRAASSRSRAERAVQQSKKAPASAVGMMGQMGRVGAELAAQEAARVMAGTKRVVAQQSDVRRFRRAIVMLRPCDNCGLEEHDLDAAFCKVCGAPLAESDNA